MSVWQTCEIPILESPHHTCNDGIFRGLFYERTVVVRQHEGHMEKDLFLMKQFNLKLYRCDKCQQQFGVKDVH